MLRISRAPGDHQGVLFRLDGQVTGQWVDELRQACEAELAQRAPSEQPPVVLDLGQVSFLDSRGVALLHSLRRQGVRLANCSMFVAEQLRDPGV